MKEYIKSALQTLKVYLLFEIVAVLFILPFYKYMFVYSLIVFILFAFAIYAELSDIAKKERRPFMTIKTFPWKGLLIGLLAMIPFMIILPIIQLINFDPKSLNSKAMETLNVGALKETISSGLLLPTYFIAKVLGKGLPAYLASLATFPVFAYIGYLSGYLGFSIRDFLSDNFGINLQLKPKKKKKY